MCCAADTCAGAGCCAQALCIATGTNAAAAQVCLGGVVTDCGAPGRPCCEDNACASGGCCSGGMCAASGAPCLGGGSCTQGACGGCGGAGKPCCKGDANGGLGNDYCTQAHTACNPATKVCATCGGPGEICCEGNRCAAGGCCDHALGGCVTAGAPGGDGLSCVDGSGGGGTCGKMSQPACGMKVGCTGDYTRNVNDLCLACGAAGQPCCAGVSRGWCAAPFACNPTTNLCASCGGDGQVCCSAGKCPAGTQHTCMNDVCH
jgi:hypothetical protein